MNERERHEAFTREMDRLEREFGGGPPRAHAPPPRNTAPMRSNHRQSLAGRQQEAYDRAARAYSPLPAILNPIVPMTAALADVPASMIDAGLARFGDRDAAVRRDARTRRWQRGTDEVARDVVSDDHAGAALIDSVKAIPGAIRQAVEAERAASDRQTIGGGRAGRPSPIPAQHTPLDYVGPIASMLWNGWADSARDARGRVAASDVLAQEAEQSGDRLGARIERRRGDDAAGDDFAITAPGALEPAFIATGQSLINAPLSLGRATTRGALRHARASIPRFLEAPVREAIGPLTQEGRRGVQAGATISAATAGGAALADAHSDAPAAPVAGAVLGWLGSRQLMRPGGAGGLERGGAIEGAAHAAQDAAPRGTLRDVQPDAIAGGSFRAAMDIDMRDVAAALEHGAATEAEIAARTGLPQSSVADALRALLNDGRAHVGGTTRLRGRETHNTWQAGPAPAQLSRRGRPPANPGQGEAWLAENRAAGGPSIAQIAQREGLTFGQVEIRVRRAKQRLLRQGLPLPDVAPDVQTRGTMNRERLAPTFERDDAWMREHRAGTPVADIAARAGKSENTVRSGIFRAANRLSAQERIALAEELGVSPGHIRSTRAPRGQPPSSVAPSRAEQEAARAAEAQAAAERAARAREWTPPVVDVAAREARDRRILETVYAARGPNLSVRATPGGPDSLRQIAISLGLDPHLVAGVIRRKWARFVAEQSKGGGGVAEITMRPGADVPRRAGTIRDMQPDAITASGRAWTEAERVRAQAMIESGRSVRDVGAELGRSPGNVAKNTNSVRPRRGQTVARNARSARQFDIGELVNELVARDEHGDLLQYSTVADNLGWDATDSSVAVEVTNLRRAASAAIDGGESAVDALAQKWNVTPDRIHALNAIPIGQQRGYRHAVTARRLVASGVTEPEAIIRGMIDAAERALVDVPDRNTLKVLATNARRAAGLTRRQGGVGAAAIGATGATGAYLLGADQADAGDGARGDSTDWLGMAGAGAAGAGALYSLVRGGRFLGDALAERAARRRILGAASEPEFRRELAAQSGRGEGEIRQGLANARAGRDPTAPVDRTELPPLPANQRRRLQRATDFHELASAFARTRRLAGETLARLAESMGVAVVRKGARLDRQATAANIILAATETTNAGRPTANALARRARLREMGLFANVEVGAADLPSRPGAPRAPGEIRANASLPPGPRVAGTASDMQPDAVQGIRGFHGSPHDFNAERLVMMPDGRLEYIVGTPNALPDIPPGAQLVHDFPLGRFREDKIGTGEGGQAYGRGVAYIAGNERVARQYRKELSLTHGAQQREIDAALANAAPELPENIRTQIAYDVQWYPEDVLNSEGATDYATRLARRLGGDRDRIRAAVAEALRAKESAGRMYEVNLNAEPEQFLDWDAPITEQGPNARQAANRILDPGWDGSRPWGRDWNPRGEDLIGPHRGTEAQRRTEILRDAGIPGIRYLDQGSRAAGEGSRNYVVFDTKIIEILRKYGLAGLGVTGAGAAALGADDAQASNGEATPSAGLSPEALAAILGGIGLGAVAAGRLRSGHTGPTLRDMARYPNGVIDTAARGGIRSDIDPRLIMGAGAIASAPVAMVGADALSDQLGENANIGQAEARTGALRGAVRRMNDAPPDAPWNYTQDAPSLLPEPTPEERRKAIERILSNARGITLADITEDDIRREADIIRRARMGMVTGRGEPGDAAFAGMR